MDFAAILAVAAVQGGHAAGESLGPELWPQPEFNAATGLTLQNCSVGGGRLNFPGLEFGVQRCTGALAESISAGEQFRYSVEVVSESSGNTRLIVAGVNILLVLGVNTGTAIAASEGSTALINNFDSAEVASFDNVSIRKVL